MQPVRVFIAIALIAYPLWVAWLVHTGHTDKLWWILCLLVLPQVLLSDWRQPRTYILIAAIALVVLGAWCIDPVTGALFYPVWMNLGFLFLFAGSLLQKPAIITRLAQALEGELPPPAVRYTERVTQVWCVFFVLNGAIALWTALLGDLKLWTLYNGFIAYVAMGLIMAIEFGVRRVVKKRQH